MSRLREVAEQRFDVVVIGAGAFGAGVAREAALNGWSVALLDQGDLGGETSSRSSKLIHGGLRYLERLEIGLVRESLRERAVLAELAPHLVRPLPFLVPVREGSRRGLLKLRLGLWLYDRLAGKPAGYRPRILDAAAIVAAEPRIDPSRLKGGGLYHDWQALDSRLVAAVALGARAAGATVVTRAAATALVPTGTGFRVTIKDRLAGSDGGEAVLDAKVVVATVGPWSDTFRKSAGGSQAPRTRLTTGVHVVVPSILERHALLLSAPSDGRVFFAIPFFGRTLLGTTDRDFSGDPKTACVAEEDIAYLLDAANAHLAGPKLTRGDVLSSFVGLRTLAKDGAAQPWRTSREQVVFEEPDGVIHVIGGKLTTWRLIARAIVERAAARGGFPLDDGRRSRLTPLPGGCFGAAADPEAAALALAARTRVPLETARRVLFWFGSRAAEVLEPARTDSRLAEAVSKGIPESRAEILHLVRHELVLTLSDALRRRLPRLLLGGLTEADLGAAAEVLGRELGWDPARKSAEVRATLAEARGLGPTPEDPRPRKFP